MKLLKRYKKLNNTRWFECELTNHRWQVTKTGLSYRLYIINARWNIG
jgi:hypothetical protein